MKKFLITFFMVCQMVANSQAADISPGNLLISSDNNIYEYTVDGNYVQNFSTEYPGGYTVTEYARDIAADANGNVYVYNGTINPYVSIYESASNTWRHLAYSGFSTANNGSYGGIDKYGDIVFVSDMKTFTGGEAMGIVAFDILNGQTVRFAEDIEPIDLTVGLDGLLYALYPGGSPGGRTINVYDPLSYEYLRSIDLTVIFGWTEHRSIAVDYNGDLFIADWDGEVHRISKDGVLIDTIEPICDTFCSFTDIDISVDGSIALGTRSGEVFVTDTKFSRISSFDGGASNFVEFVPKPVTVISVAIDIMPKHDQNKINLKHGKDISVAILTDETLDPHKINFASLVFGPNNAPADRHGYAYDVDDDGDNDYVFVFNIQETGIGCGDTVAELTGETFDGSMIKGSDSIETIGCK